MRVLTDIILTTALLVLLLWASAPTPERLEKIPEIELNLVNSVKERVFSKPIDIPLSNPYEVLEYRSWDTKASLDKYFSLTR